MAPSLNEGFAARPVGRRDASHGEAAFARARARPASRRGAENSALDPTISFLSSSGIHPAVLARATADARRLGVSADRALLANGDIEEDDFYRALARHIGAAFVTAPVGLLPGTDYVAAAAAGIAPLRRWPGGPRWAVAPRGRDIPDLLPKFDAREIVLTTPRRFEAFLRDADPTRVAADAASTLQAVCPALSARERSLQRLGPPLAFATAAAAFLAWLDGPFAFLLATVLLGACFAISCVHRIAACLASLEAAQPAPPLPDAALPTYTVIVALHREANIAGELVRALARLDYPRAKLDVKFVVESDDAATENALAACRTDLPFEIIVAPPGLPRTKPRALNVALPFARGELVTIYDAEDRPDPQQLRKAAAAFGQAPPDLACFQARLAIDNPSEGPLQGFYALDYAALFCAFNPGLAYLDLPVLLGGTSNHFRRAHLLRCGAWDAWNVTEDADLGVRLARHSFRTACFDSATGEEAPVTLRAFFKQRVRWKKGWMRLAGQRFTTIHSSHLRA